MLNPTFGTLLLWQGSYFCRNVMKGDEINEDYANTKTSFRKTRPPLRVGFDL
jgi:hypothetical protein